MNEIIVSLDQVSKCFKQYERPIDRLKDILLPGTSKAKDFWALRDLSLEIEQGETFGVIGRNGSGKSTLLQIIAGTLRPTLGQATVRGRVSALLELGSGFNPEFTGLQNVFFNGRLLGLTEVEIRDKLDEILAFADIGDFINQPVKTYSSGMFVRLAFAVVVHVDPDILIVDEALAVGDIFFQQKCFKYLDKLRTRGASILLVSHDTQAMLNLCDRTAVLAEGVLAYVGSPKMAVPKYMEMYYEQFPKPSDSEGKSSDESGKDRSVTTHKKPQEASEAHLGETFDHTHCLSSTFVAPQTMRTDFGGKAHYGCRMGMIEGIALTDAEGQARSSFEVGEDLLLSIKIGAYDPKLFPLNIGFQLRDRLGQLIIGSNTRMLSLLLQEETPGEPFIFQVRMPLDVLPQKYTMQVAIAEYLYEAKVIYEWIDDAYSFDVVAKHELAQSGLFFPKLCVATQSISPTAISPT